MLTKETFLGMAREVHLEDHKGHTGFMCLTNVLGYERRGAFREVLERHAVDAAGSLSYRPARKSQWIDHPFDDMRREEHGMHASNSARVFFLLFLAESGLF